MASAASVRSKVVRSADRWTRDLKGLFDRYLGSREHPGGRLAVLVRRVRRELEGALATGDVAGALEALEGLRRDVRPVVRDAVTTSAAVGHGAARDQVTAYTEGLGLPKYPWAPPMEGEWRSAEEAWLGNVDAFIAGLTPLALAGQDGFLLGGDNRVGLLQPATMTSLGAFWMAWAASSAWVSTAELGAETFLVDPARQMGKQCVAAIDERTTDCCLEAHGQIVPLDGNYQLTAEPRYADELPSPPFHWYCRTGEILYDAAFDVGPLSTGEMRQAADAELAAREEAQYHVDRLKKTLTSEGQYPDVRIRQNDPPHIVNLRNELRMWRARTREEIHPAHSVSRRE